MEGMGNYVEAAKASLWRLKNTSMIKGLMTLLKDLLSETSRSLKT